MAQSTDCGHMPNGCYEGRAEKITGGMSPVNMAKKLEPCTLEGQSVPEVHNPQRPSRKGARKQSRSASRR